jgi:hypothetical protein
MIKGFCSECSAKLEREGKVVYGWDHSTYWRPCKTDCDKPSKQALLINIDSIEECKHPLKKVKRRPDPLNGGLTVNYICDCGAILVPTSFEEIK